MTCFSQGYLHRFIHKVLSIKQIFKIGHYLWIYEFWLSHCKTFLELFFWMIIQILLDIAFRDKLGKGLEHPNSRILNWYLNYDI